MGTVARIHARRFSWHTTAQCLTESYEKLLESVHHTAGFLTRPLDLPPEFAAVERSGDLHTDGHV
jgi:hypothetical protein